MDDTLQLLNIQSDNDIRKYLLKAKLLGLHIQELNTYCEHKIYIISKTKSHHIMLIPSNVTHVYCETTSCIPNTYEYLANLKGIIQAAGGWGLVTTELLFHNSSANTIDLSEANLSNVVDASLMFSYSDSEIIRLPKETMNTLYCTTSMFANSCVNNLDLSHMNFSNVTDMRDMFYGTTIKLLDMTGVIITSNANTKDMFDYCEAKLVTQDRLILKAYSKKRQLGQHAF